MGNIDGFSAGLSRRRLLAGLAATGAATTLPGLAEAAPLGRPTKLHHLSVSVLDLKKSAMFYQKLFGFPPIRSLPPPGSETYGWNFNGHLLSLTRVNSKEKAGKISHYCIAVDNFNAERDGAALKAAGFQNVKIDHKDEDDWILLPDPDGVIVQILGSNYNADCKACSVPPDDAAQPTPKDAVFKATRIDHVGITSSNIDKSGEFYRKLFGFGPGRPLAAGELGFDFNGHLLSIAERPKNQAGVITHFAVAVDNFNWQRDTERLAKAGIEVRKGVDPLKNGLLVSDPDGTSVQIADTNQHWPCPGCQLKRI